MKVKKLKQILAAAHDNDEIIVSSDSEGNNFAPLDLVDFGDGVDLFWCEDGGFIIDEMELQEAKIPDTKRCLVFFPR